MPDGVLLPGALGRQTTSDFGGTITQATGKTDYSKLLGIEKVVVQTVGTWTPTRVSQADVVLRHTAADETAILMIDVTEEIRVATAKGFQLKTLDYIWKNDTANLDAHTATLDRIKYINVASPTVTSMPITGTLGTGSIATPQIAVLTVTTPVFENVECAKIVLETTVNAAATSAYDFIGVCMKFTRNDL